MTTKFKVGDRVRLVDTSGMCADTRVGALATIGPEGTYGRYTDIIWDGPLSGGMMDGGYYPKSFELVNAPAPKETTSKTWIISLLESDKLKPAREPKTYTSEAQAHRVAKEMAEKHRGSTFVVFEATGFIHVPVTPSVEVTRL